MNAFSSLTRLWPAARVAHAALRVREGKMPPARLALMLEQAGPAYIKLGQMLATRPDIVGEDVARAMEHLQDKLPPFPEAAARGMIAMGGGDLTDIDAITVIVNSLAIMTP